MKTLSHRILVMGVSGSGKSHIGRQLAQTVGATFIDGDDYHSPANVAKMASGTPLNDDDRSEWLDTLEGTQELLLERLETRAGHFFKGDTMLASQLADLEPPDEEEAFNASIALSPMQIVDQFAATLPLPSRTLG